MIRDTVRVRPKHRERSGGDCKVGKINAPFVRLDGTRAGRAGLGGPYPWAVGTL